MDMCSFADDSVGASHKVAAAAARSAMAFATAAAAGVTLCSNSRCGCHCGLRHAGSPLVETSRVEQGFTHRLRTAQIHQAAARSAR